MLLHMKYLHALNKIEGVGSQKIKKLLAYFGNAESIWRAGFSDLEKALEGNKLAEKIWQEKTTIDPDSELKRLEKENIRLIDFENPGYPALLKEMHNPPYILYTRGNLDLNLSPAIAIVGSRKYSPYGAQLAASFAHDLAAAGFVIVSGLALGIDAISHKSALEAKGKTVAILGSSIDDQNIYPRANLALAHEIIARDGLVLSDYPPETSAAAFTFPARNRLIAGLSLGTLVIEAGEKSGALITAKMALENNREVFAIPGSIFSENSVGTNNLIKSGAKSVSSIRDILEELNFSQQEKTAKKPLRMAENKEEELILGVLSELPLHIDKIGKLTNLGTAVTTSALTMMELKGWTKNIGGQNYILS